MRSWCHSTMRDFHITPTSNPSFYTGDEFYVTKVDTRVEGPWNDRDDIDTSVVPKRLRNDNMVWRPWQKSVIDLIALEPDDRTVNIIINPSGQVGKTTLCLWLFARKKAQRIPQQKDHRDIMRMIMCCPIRSCYFIDLPRAISHRDSNSMYGAIEEIKNGYAYDDRYKFTQKLFEPPHIWVFTNTKPEEGLLSRDRWKYWSINDQFELVEYSDERATPGYAVSIDAHQMELNRQQVANLQHRSGLPQRSGLTLNNIS